MALIWIPSAAAAVCAISSSTIESSPPLKPIHIASPALTWADRPAMTDFSMLRQGFVVTTGSTQENFQPPQDLSGRELRPQQWCAQPCWGWPLLGKLLELAVLQ